MFFRSTASAIASASMKGLAVKPAARTSDRRELTRCSFLDERIIANALKDTGLAPTFRPASRECEQDWRDLYKRP